MNPWEGSVPEWITALASLGALGGLLLVSSQLRMQKKQLNRDIENDYLQRYWQIRDNIDACSNAGVEQRRWRLAYLRLCEDQIDLAQAGGVTVETWAQWDSGMRGELQRFPIYAEVIRDAHPGELAGVRSILGEAVPPTP